MSHSMASSGKEILERIENALGAAIGILPQFASGTVKVDRKASDGSPVTEADRSVNRVLQQLLLRDEEGWLSEESTDDPVRLNKHRVWVVDPLDGTQEFVAGIPEWSISVAMVEDGRAIAGGVCNPVTREMFLGAQGEGMTYNGKKVQASRRDRLEGAIVLASRSEVKRGEWDRFKEAPFVFRPVGSVAYKLARVAAGLADATWTLTPKNEWDVAAGAALVEAAGGYVQFLPNSLPIFNQDLTLVPGLFACGSRLKGPITSLLANTTESAAYTKEAKPFSRE